MAVPVAVVDSFTETPFRGNPAAVCVLEGEPPAPWMQNVAAEMNLSETSFLWREGDAWRLRWFTPQREVDLCGHATLAAAHRLWETGLVPERPIRFQTLSGELVCERREGIVMSFPLARAEPARVPDRLFPALGIASAPLLEAPGGNLLIPLADEAAVRAVRPDFAALGRLDPRHGFIVTAPSGDDAYVCRYFAPAWGIDEDPVTGSIQCTLGPYWAERLGVRVLHAHQVSARGGRMTVEVQDDRVLITGKAVTVWEGRLHAAP